VSCARVDGEKVDMPIPLRPQHGLNKIERLAQIFVHPDLDRDAAPERRGDGSLLVDGESCTAEGRARFGNHIPDELALLHQRGPEGFGACPGLRAPAVEVNAARVGADER
jgi:hypothetical protein